MTSAPTTTGADAAVSPSPFWWRGQAGHRVQLGFTSVHAGNLAPHAGSQDQIWQSRRRLEAKMGVPEESLRFLHQIHSADVLDARSAAITPLSTTPTGDAWVCDDGSVPLAIMVADCLPVLFHGQRAASDPEYHLPVTAAAHAGRPGLLAGVLENTVAAMEDRGAVKITAWIGPGACGACYEIPGSMVAEISRDRPAIASTTRWGTSALDLRAEARGLLAHSGVTVEDLPGCTLEDESLFSHRRAPDQGRFAGVIWVPFHAPRPGSPAQRPTG